MMKKIITFYSYKGGVGRTMALANAACQLANKHGLDVVAVDWDLEAPGLHYYFKYTDSELRNKSGLLDYLYDFVEQVKLGNSGKVPEIKNYLTTLKSTVGKKISNGSVTLLTCGKTDDKYMSRVQNFNWDDFYSKYSGFQIIETLKKQLLELSNVVLIDSRAGQADISSTSTIQVPDAILFFFTSNEQSLDGTFRIAKKLNGHPFRINQGLDELKMLFIPSRVFSEDDRFDSWIEKTANPSFSNLIKEGIIGKEDQPKGLEQCVLGIEPRFSFSEELIVLEDAYSQSSLKVSYEKLALAITDLLEGRKLWSNDTSCITRLHLNENNEPDIDYRSVKISESSIEEIENLKKEISTASERGDIHRSAYLRYKLGLILLSSDRFDEAEVLLESSLEYNNDKNYNDATAAIEFSLGKLNILKNDYASAESHFLKCSFFNRKINNIRGEGSAIYQVGICKNRLGDYNGAIIYFKKSLRFAIKSEDLYLQAHIFNSIALSYFAYTKYDQSVKYLMQSLHVYEKLNSNYGISVSYFGLGVVAQNQRKLDKSLEYYEKSAIFTKKSKRYDDLSRTYDSIGEVLMLKGMHDEAIKYCRKAVKLAQQHADTETKARCEVNLAEAYFLKGNTDIAEKQLEKALALAKLSGDETAIQMAENIQEKYLK